MTRYVEYALDGDGAAIGARRRSSVDRVQNLTLRYPWEAGRLEAAQLTFVVGFDGLRLGAVRVPLLRDGRIEGIDLYGDPREGRGITTERVERDDAGEITSIEIIEPTPDAVSPSRHRYVVQRDHGQISELVLQRADGVHVVVYQEATRKRQATARRRMTKRLTDGVVAWATRTRPDAPVSCLAIIHSFEPYEMTPGLAWGLEAELQQRAGLGLDAYRAAEFEHDDPTPAELTGNELERDWSVLTQTWSDDSADDTTRQLFRDAATAVARKLKANRTGLTVFAVEADYTDLQEALHYAGADA